MSCTLKSATITIAAAALSMSLFVAGAQAGCKIVKVDGKCWGDTCATRQVCDRSALEKGSRRAPDSFARATINRGPFNKRTR